MARASREERDYFERIGRANAVINDESAPASLAEMFDRLDEIRRLHGALARPGVAGPDDGDWASHLAFLERLRAVGGRGAQRP